MRFLCTLLLAVSPAVACSCITSGSACSAVEGSVVFVAQVVIDSGEKFGTRPAQAVIEEALRGVPEDLKEVEINSSFGTSCHYPLKQGERYVFFTSAAAAPHHPM